LLLNKGVYVFNFCGEPIKLSSCFVHLFRPRFVRHSSVTFNKGLQASYIVEASPSI